MSRVSLERQIAELVDDEELGFTLERFEPAPDPAAGIGETVTVSVAANTVEVAFAGKTVASHVQSTGRFQVIRCPEHFHGIFRAKTMVASPPDTAPPPEPSRPDLLRPLSVYDDIVGGGWE